MGGALGYLLLTRLKNQLHLIARSPGKAIIVLMIIGLVLLPVFTGKRESGFINDMSQYRNPDELTAGIFVLLLVAFYLIAKKGFDRGASLFTMADVNFIFPAPITPQRVLFFGLLQQLKASLLIAFFLLFKYAWLNNTYGINIGTLVVIVCGYSITVFCGHLTAMTIYTFTNADEKKRNVMQAIFYGILLLYFAFLLVGSLQYQGGMLDRVVYALNSGLVRSFPVVGWIGAAVVGYMTTNTTMTILGLIGGILYIGALIVLIIVSKQEYYEDVLKSTETTHSSITARKEGNMNEILPRNIKLGKTGFDKGAGAQAFYYKHVIENRRGNTFYVNQYSLIVALSTIAFAFFSRELGVIPVFAFSVYMLIFGMRIGRFSKELNKPYIYLVPESSFLKLLANVRESLPRFLIEALVIFIPVGLLLRMSVIEIAFCVLAHTSFAILFTVNMMLVGRIFGTFSKNMFTFGFYMLATLILSLPGIAGAIVVAVIDWQFISMNVTMLAVLLICNIVVSLVVMLSCRNMLQYAEWNYR